MAYHTLVFLVVFLPLVILFYQLAGKKYRPMVLLAAGYLFFFSFSRMLCLYLLGVTAVLYVAGIAIEKCQQDFNEQKKGQERNAVKELKKVVTKQKKHILLCGLLILLGVLLCVKYYNFFAGNINGLLAFFSLSGRLPQLRILQPIGISFYTLQGIGYLVDVYEGKIEAEHHFGRLALFMAFFPQIMEGPISRYGQTAEKLYAGTPVTEHSLIMGACRICWGMFKKIIIADRLNPFVEHIFEGYIYCGGVTIFLGAIAYTLQLYMEFSGGMDIVIGVAEIFGVILPENFRQPFFSKNVSEFWRRWHITLGAWLKDYIFYSVSLSERVKKAGNRARKKFGKHGNKIVVSAAALFPVWFCNGIWHGARWSYLFFGMYYFVLIMLSVIFEPLFERFRGHFSKLVKNPLYAVFQMFRTAVLVVIGELFFRAGGLKHGMLMFARMVTNFQPGELLSGNLMELGLSPEDFLIIFLCLIVVFVVSCCHEKGIHVREKMMSLPTAARWCVYYGLMFSVIILGAYGDGYLVVELIYAGF